MSQEAISELLRVPGTPDIGMGETGFDGGFLLAGHCATDVQAVNLQAVEPLGQFDLAGEVEGEPPDVRQQARGARRP